MLSDSEAKTLAQRLDHLEDLIRNTNDYVETLRGDQKVLANRIEQVYQGAREEQAELRDEVLALSNRIESVTQSHNSLDNAYAAHLATLHK